MARREIKTELFRYRKRMNSEKTTFAKCAASLLVAMTLVMTVAAQSHVKIHGKIFDQQDEPLEFVTVKVAGTAVGTTSGLDGGYSLSVAPADTLRVVFTCLGFNEERRQLVNPKGDIVINLKMTPKTIDLGGVEVTEFKRQTGSMQQLEGDAYKIAPDASGNGVESMLTTIAGVNSSNEMSSQYSVRGGTYDENCVYINGIEVYRPLLITSGQQEGLSVINSDLVGSIQFSTGGFPAEYGDKMSSALDITYREPEAFEGSVSASLMGGSLSLGHNTGRFSQLHGVRYKSNASLLSSMETKGEYDPKYFDYQTNLNWKIGNKFKVSFLGNVSVNNYKFTPVNRTTNFGTSTDAKQFKVYFDGWEKDRFETYFGAGTINYRMSKSTDFSLLASGFLTNELVAYDIQGEYWLDQAGTTGESGDVVGGELGVGRYQEHARNRLKASVFALTLKGNTSLNRNNISYGLTYRHEKIFDRSREWEERDSAGYSLPSYGDAVRTIYSLSSRHDLSTNRFSAFVQDAYKFSTNAGVFSLIGGVRLSHWDFNGETIVSPRASLGFIPAKNTRWAFRFATGLYYQAPFYKEYRRPVTLEEGNSTIVLNTNIKSQRSFQAILGADYAFRAIDRPFKFTAEVYYKNLSNLIPYEVDNLKVTYSGVNSSKGYTAGLDMKFFGQFVPGTDSWISFSLMKTQEDLNGVKVPRPTDQRYSFAMYFTDFFPGIPKLKFSLRGIFSDGLPTTAPQSSRDVSYFRTPAYKRLDIGLNYALLEDPKEGQQRSGIAGKLKSVWVGLDVFNLFDISNVSNYYWVTDVNRVQYAVPNYLTRRQINLRLTVNF